MKTELTEKCLVEKHYLILVLVLPLICLIKVLIVTQLFLVPMLLWWARTMTAVSRHVSSLFLQCTDVCVCNHRRWIKFSHQLDDEGSIFTLSFTVFSPLCTSKFYNEWKPQIPSPRKYQRVGAKIGELLLFFYLLIPCYCLKEFVHLWKNMFFLCWLWSLKNFIVDDFSSDDDFIEKKPSHKGNTERLFSVLRFFVIF